MRVSATILVAWGPPRSLIESNLHMSAIILDGWVAERFKAPVLKTGVGASPPWVRIPPHPPFHYL